ncbi:lipase 3 [Acyrthosiphon pisum]|uniref:Partial AB-hydrolase lipase domain-containing protein n=1 Tax=Acyrthosiphon pisum TaxID=7029 RepID=A0A8R2A7L2_ACYPI|nr:lipase 3 [Acyrthosiphon pisum]|eukprot:XP_001952550.2 PREDICTED: lipase 3 [Acyrthosiphon pisum]
MTENVCSSTVEIVKNNGYAVEVHNVVTEDGYILELHRISENKSGHKPTRNHPVFVHHGVLGSSADWVLGGADISLPMQLSDAGYDVWLANCRGNTYSRKHSTMTSKQREFWNFSLHEVGTFDLPASLDYILMKTNAPQLHYVGYSMGTSVFFIMASERPEYHHKIRSQISLAPVAYLFNTRSSVRHIAPYAEKMNIMYQWVSNGMFLPQSRMQSFLVTNTYGEKIARTLFCQKCISYAVSSVCGSETYIFDNTLIPLVIEHFPAGTSSKLTTHFSQLIMKDSFSRYDYGPIMNLQHYNSTEPPTYDLSSIQVPIALIYGKNDVLTDVEDVMRLKSQLPKLMDFVPVDSPRCNHVDFLWSLDVTKQVNAKVAEILQKTDHADWEYTGPPSGSCTDTDGTGGNDSQTTKERQPNSTSDHNVYVNFAPGPDCPAMNSSGGTPVQQDESELVRGRKLIQKLQLLDNLIVLLKSTETKYHRLRDGLTREFSEWTRGARNEAGTHHGAEIDAVAAAGVEDTVVGVKTEQTTATLRRIGIGKVSDFVDYCNGLNRMDDRTAAGRALYTTFSSLGRAIRFLKLRYK